MVRCWQLLEINVRLWLRGDLLIAFQFSSGYCTINQLKHRIRECYTEIIALGVGLEAHIALGLRPRAVWPSGLVRYVPLNPPLVQ